MTIKTPRFGEIQYENDRVIRIGKGLLGFESLTRYVLVNSGETWPVVWLQSVEDAEVALPVIHTFEIIEDYAFDAQDDDIAALELKDLSELLLLNVVVIPEDIAQMTANLAAPILVNTRRSVGCQILIDQQQYAIKTPIFEKICAFVKKEEPANAGADA